MSHGATAGAALPPPDCDTLARLFAWRVGATPERTAYRQHDAAAGQWRDWSWSAVGALVQRFVAALATPRGVRGERVATLLPNGLTAVCVDQAALALACVPVPMHALDNPQSVAYILADSGASVLFVEQRAQWDALAALGVALPALRQVIVVQPGAPDASGAAPTAHACGLPAAGAPVQRNPAPTSTPAPSTGPDQAALVTSLDDWLAGAPAAGAVPARAPALPEDLAALVYTSGTTGRPKGVMLTHANVMANVRATLRRVSPHADDCLLSFLPLSHTFERTVGYYLPVAAGCAVAFARSVADLAEDLRTVRPTVLVSVPRIYERVQVKVDAALAAAPLRRAVFRRAVDVGWRRFRRANGLETAPALRALADALAWPVLDRLAGAALRAQFGGRLRLAVSGGAPLAPAVARTFLALGVPLVQGYGMTETAPVVACNAPGDNDPATVGRVLDGVEVRIGADRELQVRGASVMRGYWQREADTAAAFVDGWLRTGDQAALENGRVRILGRLKEILVTSTGEKVAPADVEQAIAADPLFEQVALVGEGRPFVACIAVLNRALWAQLAAGLGLAPAAADSLAAPAAVGAALARIRRQTAQFPAPAQPRRVLLTLEPWTLENSLLTPTLKLKRLNLAARFGQAIEALYAPR